MRSHQHRRGSPSRLSKRGSYKGSESPPAEDPDGQAPAGAEPEPPEADPISGEEREPRFRRGRGARFAETLRDTEEEGDEDWLAGLVPEVSDEPRSEEGRRVEDGPPEEATAMPPLVQPGAAVAPGLALPLLLVTALADELARLDDHLSKLDEDLAQARAAYMASRSLLEQLQAMARGEPVELPADGDRGGGDDPGAGGDDPGAGRGRQPWHRGRLGGP